MEHNTFVISGLKEKRSAVAGRIIDLRREADRLQADLAAVDAVLRLYEVDPSDIPTKGRMGVKSVYFGRGEITRRCRDLLREKGTIKADDVTVQAMRDKGMDPENRRMRTDFTKRILVSLHDLRKAGVVIKTGHGRGVTWRLKEITPT